MQSQFEQHVYGLRKNAQATEAKIRSSLEGKRADAEKRAAETKEKAAKMKSRYEELLKQEETDNDQEVRLQRVAKEKLVAHEREVALSLKGEAAIMRKKLEASQTDMDALKGQLKAKEREITKLQREGADRDKAVALLKRDIAEREESIADKERRMSELKATPAPSHALVSHGFPLPSTHRSAACPN